MPQQPRLKIKPLDRVCDAGEPTACVGLGPPHGRASAKGQRWPGQSMVLQKGLIVPLLHCTETCASKPMGKYQKRNFAATI